MGGHSEKAPKKLAMQYNNREMYYNTTLSVNVANKRAEREDICISWLQGAIVVP